MLMRLLHAVAVGDSIVVANANVAAYNGTFTVASVSSTQITYVSGGSATDSLVAPFPTVKLAAGKRVYTAPADALVYAVIMFKGTVGTPGAGLLTTGVDFTESDPDTGELTMAVPPLTTEFLYAVAITTPSAA